jgi:hypothetical protein
MSGPPANPNAWRPSDLEAIRRALLIPVTAPALRAINDAMAQLERSYPEAIPAAKASLDAIAVIDAGLTAGGTPAEPFVIKTTRKAAAGPVPAELPKKKLDVIEYATELLMEEVSTEYAEPTANSYVLSSGAQRRAHVANLLLTLPGLAAWCPPAPTPFSGTMIRS